MGLLFVEISVSYYKNRTHLLKLIGREIIVLPLTSSSLLNTGLEEVGEDSDAA